MARESELDQLRKDNLLLQAEVERLSTPPYRGATVLEVGKKTLKFTVDGGGFYEVAKPNGEFKDKLALGARLTVNKELGIVDVSEFRDQGSQTAIVDEVEKDRLRVESKGESRYVLSSLGEVKPGDEILLDSSGAIAIEKLARKKTKYTLEEIPKVEWTQIGGLESVVAQIKDEVELPFMHSAVFERYGRKPANGILLYGPPGCGKTLVAKGIAFNLAKIANNGNGHFINVKGPEILDKFVGNSEANVRRIYQAARECANGAPVVIFVDEAESVLRARGTGISSDVYDSIVPQFLSEMDGLQSNHNIITVLATNREDILDPALLRSGRIDRRINVTRPTKEGAKEIFGIYLEGKPMNGIMSSVFGIQKNKLRDEIVDEIYSGKPVIELVDNEGRVQAAFSHRHLVSGAMIKGIVDRACGYAIKREIEGGKKGLSREDIYRATNEEFTEASSFFQNLTRDDWRDAFGDKGKQYFHMVQSGYLTARPNVQTLKGGRE